MKADTVQLVHIFGTDRRHVVPIFQRPYVWEEERNWAPLGPTSGRPPRRSRPSRPAARSRWTRSPARTSSARSCSSGSLSRPAASSR